MVFLLLNLMRRSHAEQAGSVMSTGPTVPQGGGSRAHGPGFAGGRVPQQDVHKSFSPLPSSHPRHSFPHIPVFLPACYSYSSALAIMLHGNTVRLLAGTFAHLISGGGQATAANVEGGQY